MSEGAMPSETCDGQVVDQGAGSRDVTGMPPSHDDETAWLKTFVEKP